MKKLLVAFAVLFSVGTVVAQTKIAHVKTQNLLDSLPSRQDAMKKLQEFEANGVKELQEMEADFNAAYAKYEKDRASMIPVEIKMAEDKLMKKQQSLQDREQALQQEMQVYSQELNKPILERVQKAVEIVSERKKINYVLDESVALYSKGGIDITAEVKIELMRLDAEAMKN